MFILIKIEFNGGLGNQIYQLCMALFLINKGNVVTIGLKNYSENNIHDGFKLNELFDLSYFNMPGIQTTNNKGKLNRNNFLFKLKNKTPLSIKVYSKLVLNHLNYYLYKILPIRNQFWTEEMLKKLWNDYADWKFNPSINYVLFGYFQDNELVNYVIQDLKKLIKYVDFYNSDHKELFERIKQTQSVLIHFRGGDFMSNKNNSFNILTSKYYLNAIMEFQSKLINPVFYLYYDDAEQMRLLMPESIKNVVIIGRLSNNSVYDFLFQLNHRYYICSNSTFSWWSAKLSNTSLRSLIPIQFINKVKKNKIYINDFKDIQ